MAEWKLMGTENPRTGDVHTWITADGKSVTLEDVVEELHYMRALLETAVDAMSTNGIQCGLSEAWLDEAKRVTGWDDEEEGGGDDA